MKKILLAIFLAFASISALYAVSAYPGPITVKQPDGTPLVIHLHGDEYLNWATCGNSLVAKGSDGWWRYASFNNQGVAKSLGATVRVTSSGDGKNVVPPASAVEAAAVRRKELSGKRTESSNSSISIGEKRFLILLIEFADKKFTMDKSYFTDKLSSDNYTYNGATGSVKQYYEEVSFGKFSPIYDVYGPIQVTGTSAQYAEDDVNAVIDACKFAHDSLGVNFANYCNQYSDYVDNVFFFFPGYNQAEGGGDDTIWPHAVTYYQPFLYLDNVGIYRYGCTSEFSGSSGEVFAGIGTFSHEFGHILGLPDIYDVDYSENGQALGLSTLSLMDSGNYNNEGRTPPYLTYEEKRILGWDEGLTLISEGSNALSKTSENKSYYFPTTTDGEYYVIESRPAEGWDAYTYANGMAVYHVDRSDYQMPSGYTASDHWDYGYMINAYSEHQCMDLIETVCPESEVQYYQELVFPGYRNITEFTSATSPASVAWDGTATGYNLSNIAFNSTTGITTFDLSKECKITGTVKNTSGQVICGAEIKIQSVASESDPSMVPMSSKAGGLAIFCARKANNGVEYTVYSDENGYFEQILPSGGTYSVSATCEGYMKYQSNVSVDASVVLDIVLSTPADEAGINLQKYSEISGYAVGYYAGTNCYAGLKYTAEELKDYVGADITSVSFMACNGGDGTADYVGIQIYFDDEIQCDYYLPDQVFNTICTVNVKAAGLTIPEGKSVTFSYYVENPSYDYSCAIADWGAPVTNANLIRNNTSSTWYAYPNGNMVISARITDKGKVVDLAGFNYIRKASSYKAGDSFEFELVQSSVNPPSSVNWKFDGEEVSGSSVVLTAGTHTVTALLTYASGRTEIVETKIKVEN